MSSLMFKVNVFLGSAQGCGQTEKLENKHHLAKKTSGKMGELIHCLYLMCLFVI